MKSMKSIKNKLLLTILGVALGFSFLIFTVVISQFFMQKSTISKQGQRQAKELSKETKETLKDLNAQVARDFSSACTKYFNMKFQNIRRHVAAIGNEVTDLYAQGADNGPLDQNVGLVSGIDRQAAEADFTRISPVRGFIKNLPSYDTEKLNNLDLYIVTETGMCMDGTQTPLGNDYADLRKEDWYHAAKEKGETYWSGIFTGKVTGKVKVICAEPFYDADGRFCGCAAGDMTVESFQQILEDFNEEQIKSVIFFDTDGTLMHATNSYRNAGGVAKYVGKKEIVREGDEIYSFSKLAETGWTICLVLDQTVMNEAADNLQTGIEQNAQGIMEIVQGSIQKSIFLFLIIAAAGCVLVIIITNFVAAGFVSPIRQLMEQVRIVGSGNLDQKIEVTTKDEIGQLADAFHSMTGELKDYIANVQSMTADKERMTAELNVAKQIQMNMLPSTFPAFPDRSEFDIYATVHAATDGGGNFYDFFMVDKSHLCMVIGDVSGSGIPTTLFAVVTKTHIKNYAQLGYQPDRILMETNNQLSYKNEAGLTVSVFIGLVDLSSGVLTYVNAGQMEPLWKHSGQEFEFLKAKSCFALASMENVPYLQQSIQLAQGDMLFMHTQGVAQTLDEKDSEYTQEYLYEYLNGLVRHEYKLEKIMASIEDDLSRFAGGTVQKQDSTMLLFRYFGK